MKLFSLATKREGEKFPDAWVSIGKTKDSNGRGAYMSACIPVPVFQQYEEFDSCLLCEGWRVIRAIVVIRRNSAGRWFVRGGTWMHPLSKRAIRDQH